MNRHCVLTFDYELFLGEETGTALRSIIEPTDRIIELFKKHESKGIFYVDAGYLLKLKEYNHSDLEAIGNQLRELISIGSSVELHIHPQWLDAVFDGDNWSFSSFDKFRLHSLNSDRLTCYFLQCKQVLEETSGAPVRGFRAGGWCLQPFKEIGEAFDKAGIVLDSSVTPGLVKNNLPHHYYNYSGVIHDNVYRFESDPCEEVIKGKFRELPVTTHKIHGMTLFLNALMLRKYNNRVFGDGRGLYKADGLAKKFRRIFAYNMRTLSVEGMFPALFRYEYEKQVKNTNCLPCLVMHPKTISELALMNLEYVCRTSSTLSTAEVLDRS